jgi:hypothetical protein
MEGLGRVPIPSLKSLQTTHNPPKRPLWGLAAPGVEPPPDNPARKCKHSLPDWACDSILALWLAVLASSRPNFFGGIFSLSIRPFQPRGKPGAADRPSNSFPAMYVLCDTAKHCASSHNPSVSFADSSRLEGERSEPEGAAKFILRPGTPARRSRGWGENTQGSLWEQPLHKKRLHETIPLHPARIPLNGCSRERPKKPPSTEKTLKAAFLYFDFPIGRRFGGAQ